MKKFYLFLLLTIFSVQNLEAQGCICANQYPAGNLTPLTSWSSISACNYAGEYAVINVVAGNIYEFSTCAAYGSNVSYDSELTLLSNAQQLLAYNDDFCGNQSYISWTATYTGTVQIHLTEYYLGAGCYTNMTCSTIRYKMTAGSLVAPINNNCASPTILTPSANCNLVNGTTLGATEDLLPDPSCDLAGVFNDVWYSFNSGAFTTVNLTVNLGTAALVGVEFYTSCGNLATGINIGGSPGNCDFNTNAPNPTVFSGLTPNTNYLFRLFTNASYDTPGTFTACLTTPPPPTVSVNSTNVCAGQSITLTATPSVAGGTYLWSNGAITPTITVNPNVTTTYTVTYSNNGTATGSGTVTVNPAPTINAGQDQTVCQGANVTLSGTGGSSYTWNNGVNNGVAFVPNATTTYTVTGTDANGCTNTDQVTVTVNALPTVNAVNNQTLCTGASASAVAFSGTAGASFAWVNSNPSIGLTANGTGNISVFTAANATANPITGTITVTPSQAGCTGTPQTFTITVNPNPTITGNNSLCVGATLQLTGSGTAAANNAWASGTPANGTVSNAGLVTAVNAGSTVITYTNVNGCIATQAVTINANPTISGNIVICPNTTSQLTANANPAASNAWTSSNNAVATISNTGLVNAVSFGTSTITFTNTNGCTATANVNVTNPVAPTFNPISAVCSGGSITLPAASTNNVQGTWLPAVNNTQTTTYTFTPSAGQCATTAQQTVTVNPNPTISGGNIVCVGSTLQLTGSGSPAVNTPWVSGAAAIGSVSNNGLFTALSPGTSVLTYTNSNGCFATKTVTVQGPVIASPQQVTACLSYLWNGQTYVQSGTYSDTLQTVVGCDSIVSLNLTISDSITGPTTQQNACGPYTWNGQIYAQSGTYTYNGTTQNGCDSSATLVLTIDLAPSNATLSLNAGTFTATAQNANSYLWLDCATNTPIPGATTATFTPVISGSYAAVAMNACGSDTTTCEPIEVQGLNEFGNSTLMAYPNPTRDWLTVKSTQETIETIEWLDLNGRTLETIEVNGLGTSLNFTDFSNGVYFLRITRNSGKSLLRIVKQ
ncbi:MAG: T9SS C-terminal target domain-containing protein [Flavobacteriia bacterium]|nr:T9SS C-terminal target domain-containing protein [Flavobacteriia bacterium]